MLAATRVCCHDSHPLHSDLMTTTIMLVSKQASSALMTATLFILISILLTTTTFASPAEKKALATLPVVDRLKLASVIGPESIAFDPSGKGPYTGVSDGRILRWRGRVHGWAEFAVTSKNRPRACDGSNVSRLEGECGRPLGLKFNNATGELYIADAYFGLVVVGPEGGAARLVAAGADGQRFHFTNGVDIDQETGVVYFTDSSTTFSRRDYILCALSGDSTGRLLKYDPQTKKLTVLLRGVTFPNGLAVSADRTYLLVAETSPCRIMKYWLRGPKAGKYELFAELPGYPDNIKLNQKGELWVALNQEKIGTVTPADGEHAVALRMSKEGKVLEVLDGDLQTSISEVEERNGTLWVGSVSLPYVGVYQE